MSFGHFDCNVGTNGVAIWFINEFWSFRLQFGYRWLKMNFGYFDCNVVTNEFSPFLL